MVVCTIPILQMNLYIEPSKNIRKLNFKYTIKIYITYIEIRNLLTSYSTEILFKG